MDQRRFRAKAQRRKERRKEEKYLNLCSRVSLLLSGFAGDFFTVRMRKRELPFAYANQYNSGALLTLTQLTVTSMLSNVFQNRSAKLKRALGLLLVVFIFYGTTVEAAHRHGRIAATPAHATSLAESTPSSSNLGVTPGCNHCLICQLHQNFSATLISVKPETQPLTRITHLSRTIPTSVNSTAYSPLSGRAPPQTN